MALKLWLPLTGHMNNHGLSKYTMTNSGGVVESEGKLGSCYYFDKLSFMFTRNFELSTNAFSVCYWIKYTAFTSSNNYAVSLNKSSSSDFQFMIGTKGTGGAFALNTSTSDTNLSTNRWYHCCVTYDGTEAYMYLDGTLVKIYNTITVNLGATNLTINGRCNTTSTTSMDTTGKTSFYINDIRIYDHCLSKQEVRDISKGLVLHHDFDDPYIETTAYDCSGYSNNGTVTGVIQSITDTAKGTRSIDFASSGYITTSINTNGFKDSYTISHWVKKPNNGSVGVMSFGFRNSETAYRNLYWKQYLCWNTGDGSENPFVKEDGTAITHTSLEGEWHHLVITGDGTTTILYIDGEKAGTATTYKNIGADGVYIGNGHRSDTYKFDGSIADFAIYSTVLSADDIKSLYNRRVSIDKQNNIIGAKLVESDRVNLFDCLNEAVFNKNFTAYLSHYSQQYATQEITDDGVRLYRPANINTDEHGQNMFGGLKISNVDNYFGLIKGHTYILKFHVKGKSSKGFVCGWVNNFSWTGGGLNPTPSDVSRSANFSNDNLVNIDSEFFYKWTINDEVHKVCTSSYSSFVEGQTYVSYKDFRFYQGYGDTGELGTDVYLSNFRLYDITDGENPVDITKKFTITADFYETGHDGQKAKIYKNNTVQSAQFIE